jgi:universal stress protein A
MFAPKRILVPTDFSEFSDHALTEAMDIARQHKSTVYVFHVLSLIQQCSSDYCLPADTVEEVRRESMKSAKEMMQQEVDKARGTTGVEVITDIREGASTSGEILKEQKEKDVDLIVIASHGKSGFLHHLIGSVADKVTRGAPCPVYLVRGTK